MITVSHFWPLALLLAVPFIWRVRRRTAMGLADRHLKLATVLRVLVVVLLALALMKPVWNRAGRWVSVVYALDISSSVDAGFIGAAIDWIEATDAEGDPAHSAFLAFAATPRRIDTADAIRSVRVSSDGGADGLLDRNATDIEAALLESLRAFDARYLKRLVLITDGNETAGDLRGALGRLQQEGVRVYTLPATVGREGDAWIDVIELPSEVREDEPVAADVQVFARAATRASVELFRDDELLDTVTVDLEPGRNHVPFEVALEGTGPVRLRGRLTAESDPFAANDGYLGSAWVGDRPRVLYVEGFADSVRYLRDALDEEGIDVTTATAAQLPVDPAGLEEYDAVILSDVPATLLGEARMRALETYVRDFGGGLVFAGGENTYGEGGYSETRVEEVLPVWFRIDEERKDLALIIVLDKSFSMVGPKIELSKEAAKAALALLEDNHRFGLLTFDHSPYWTVPLQYATNKERINEYISSIIASAHTNIYPALERAYLALADIEAEVKHVILLSDGKTYPDDYETLVGRMAESEITVSTVAVGEEADRELLGSIAEWGSGRTYFIRDAERVPQVFIEETQLAAQRTLIEEPFDMVLQRDAEAFRGIDFSTAPDLKGFVSTQAKETAEVLLESTDESPLLARWQYGLGKTAIFTSDVKNRWAADWLTWDGYGKFWAQLVRETMRREPGEEIDFRVQRQGREAVVTVDAVDAEGYFRNELAPRVDVVSPDGERTTLDVGQVGPGSYRTTVPLTPSDTAPWSFELLSEEGPVEGATRDLFYPYADEFRLFPPDGTLLRAVADQTGGAFAPEAAEIFADHGDVAQVPTPLWPWLAGAALILYLLDIAVRRAPWFWHWLGSTKLGSAKG